ncbi:MAG: cbb3-type cytochrome c oxidase subunit I, partial [Alphaproteobacteria bacterium]|nr:cbb3-type cytochrome c oxidase subunit I [Alphaproteobacteria bacterium]
MKHKVTVIALAIAAVLALMGTALGRDDLFRAHSGILFVVLTATAFFLLNRSPLSASTDAGSIPFQGGSDTNPAYIDGPIRYGVIATLFWGIVGFLVGIVIASQLAWPDLNLEPYLNFGRLRPLHTSAVIFAFGG